MALHQLVAALVERCPELGSEDPQRVLLEVLSVARVMAHERRTFPVPPKTIQLSDGQETPLGGPHGH